MSDLIERVEYLIACTRAPDASIPKTDLRALIALARLSVGEEMVERVARALIAETEVQTDDRWPQVREDTALIGLVDDDLSFRGLARAAIAAITGSIDKGDTS